jgi:hypothetical protein
MPLTEQHTRLALIIDTHVREILGDGAILIAMADDMGTFKQWLDTCTDADMDALCERYDGLYRFATLLEQLAEGITKDRIPVPACRATCACPQMPCTLVSHSCHCQEA